MSTDETRKYRYLLREWLEDPILRIVVFNNIKNTHYSVTKGKFGEWKKNPDKLNKDLIYNYIDSKLIREGDLKATIYPSMIQYSNAINLYIRSLPTNERNNVRWLRIVSFGLGLDGNTLVYIDGVDEGEWREFVKYLVSNKADPTKWTYEFDYRMAIEKFYLRRIPINGYKYLSSLAVLALLTWWLIEYLEGDPQDLLSGSYTMYILSFGRSKTNEYDAIPNLNRVIGRWMLTDDMEGYSQDLGVFISSLYFRQKANNNKKSKNEKILSLMDKFAYYILHNYVSGSLLDQLVSERITHELSKEGSRRGSYNGFPRSKSFLNRL